MIYKKSWKYILIKDYTYCCIKNEYYRPKAIKDFSDVSKNDIGGYVGGYHNLSQNGNCWIYDKAGVYENAVISEDAIVKDKAYVTSNAKISGKSKIFGNAQIFGNAIICDNAQVCGFACVHGNAHINRNTIVKKFMINS